MWARSADEDKFVDAGELGMKMNVRLSQAHDFKTRNIQCTLSIIMYAALYVQAFTTCIHYVESIAQNRLHEY